MLKKLLKNQTYSNWELIVVDDASKDETLKIIEEYLINKKINLIRNEINKEISESRNSAINASFFKSRKYTISHLLKLRKQYKIIYKGDDKNGK